jgi:AraC-like DNA-binding protein
MAPAAAVDARRRPAGLGASVTEAALDAGYASTSAFTVAYRRHFGTTPSEAKAR